LTRRAGTAALSLLPITTSLASHATAPKSIRWPNSEAGQSAAVACEASYVVIGKRLSAAVPARRVSAIINLWGLVLSAPMGLYWAWSFNFGAVQVGTWALLLFYALAASVFTVWLWMNGLEHVSAQGAGIFTVFLPLSSAAVGVGVLGEPWSAAHGAALMLALAAVWLVTRAGPEPLAGVPAGPHQTPRRPDEP
ncbi:MAG: EamA family transporter, partial [Betaproteobacteria bacterium]